tara:strand:+ start:28 stop:882 length:855 start_codon:yes stop_codon:yes gene_type:complete
MIIINYDYYLQVGTGYDVIVALGAEEGTDVAQGVWYRHREDLSGAQQELTWSHVARRVLCGRDDEENGEGESIALSDPNGFSQTCWQRWFESSDIIGAIPAALVLGVDGLTGPGVGRDVLKKLSAGSYDTLPAFRSEAIRAVTQLTWVKFGRYFVLTRFVLMILVYVPLHICVLGYNDQELEHMRHRLWETSTPTDVTLPLHMLDAREHNVMNKFLGDFVGVGLELASSYGASYAGCVVFLLSFFRSFFLCGGVFLYLCVYMFLMSVVAQPSPSRSSFLPSQDS